MRGLLAALALCCIAATARPSAQVVVGPGTFRPPYPATDEVREAAVGAFRLDRLPVTNAEFLAFVKKHPKWRRDRISRLFAEERYLSHWAGPVALGKGVDPKQPVVQVSWFAAKAYCAARGARLPTEAEWELAAAASETSTDGTNDPAWREEIVAWYSRPNGVLARVGAGKPNAWGVHDLHGLVWEWVYDYNSTLIAVDDREQPSGDQLRFCGVGAVDARDPTDYTTFMRYAFRSALEADYTTTNLGFRCAADGASP